MSKKGFHWSLLVVLLGGIGLIWLFPRPGDEPALLISAGQRTRVESIAFSPDGKMLVIGVTHWDTRGKSLRHSAEVQRRDAQTGDLLGTLPLPGSVNGPPVSFLSDGHTVAIGPGGSMLWNTRTDEFTPHNKGPYKAVPKGFWVVAATSNVAALTDDKSNLWLWNKKTRRMTRLATGCTWIARAQVFSPDGKTLASGAINGTVKLWDTQARRLQRTLIGHRNVLSTIAFSPDGKILASGDGLDARLWDVKTGKLMRTLTPPNRVFSVVFSPDGKTLASGGPNFDRGLISNALTRTSNPKHRAARRSSGEVRLWDVQTGQLLRTLKGGHWVLSIAYAPDGKALANTSDDDTVRVWRLQ